MTLENLVMVLGNLVMENINLSSPDDSFRRIRYPMTKRMKRERGQASILVLILLAVGSLMIVPVLCLSNNTLKSSQMYMQFANEDYAADAAMEYGL